MFPHANSHLAKKAWVSMCGPKTGAQKLTPDSVFMLSSKPLLNNIPSFSAREKAISNSVKQEDEKRKKINGGYAQEDPSSVSPPHKKRCDTVAVVLKEGETDLLLIFHLRQRTSLPKPSGGI